MGRKAALHKIKVLKNKKPTLDRKHDTEKLESVAEEALDLPIPILYLRKTLITTGMEELIYMPT
jgi:hypothetical protein